MPVEGFMSNQDKECNSISEDKEKDALNKGKSGDQSNCSHDKEGAKKDGQSCDREKGKGEQKMEKDKDKESNDDETVGQEE